MTDADKKAANGLTFLHVHLGEGLPLVSVAREAGVAVRTARRWLARFRRAGPTGLAPKSRSDLGARKIARELVELIVGMAFTEPQQSVATIRLHRWAAAVAQEQG